MRLVLIFLLLAGALWRAVVDWQATIAQGYAYRFASIETVLAETWPGLMSAVEPPGWWEQIGATLGSLPLSLVLAGIAALLWLTRRRNRGR